MPRLWTDERVTDEVTVFWAGDKSRLLKNDGGVKFGKKRILSRIRTFPLRFVANEWASKNTKAAMKKRGEDRENNKSTCGTIIIPRIFGISNLDAVRKGRIRVYIERAEDRDERKNELTYS